MRLSVLDPPQSRRRTGHRRSPAELVLEVEPQPAG